MRPQAFRDLWALAETLDPETKLGLRRRPAYTFDCSSVGLILRQEVGPYSDVATPLNADTFAETGGDSVHFSFLLLDGRSAEELPVVMTVPTAGEEQCHIIVGESLLDFLSLGCRFGYFALEDLAYDRDDAIARIASGAHAFPDISPDDRLLAAIRERFCLQPWVNVESRLAMLHERYHPLLRLWGGLPGE